MSILLKGATIVDNKSNLNFKIKDILIKDGVIVDIADNIKTKSKNIIDLKNLHVSRGWMDTSVCFGEPGYEERETISNGLETAASSGFTSILLNPNCDPIIDNHSSIEFLKRKSIDTTTQIYPIGSLTNNSNGKDLAPLYDMKIAGAVAYGDYKQSINDSSLLKISLEYTKTIGGRIISFSQDEFLSEKEQIQYIREWWQENRSYIFIVILVVVGGITGNNVWKSSIAEKQLSASTLYESLAVGVSDNNSETAEEIADQIFNGYKDTVYFEKAKLAMAYFYMSQSRDEDAANSLRDILQKSEDHEISLIAEYRLAKIMLYQKKYQEVIDMLTDNNGHAFETKYSELLGDAYYGLQKYDAAEAAYLAALRTTNQPQVVDAALIQMKINDLPDTNDSIIIPEDEIEITPQ